MDEEQLESYCTQVTRHLEAVLRAPDSTPLNTQLLEKCRIDISYFSAAANDVPNAYEGMRRLASVLLPLISAVLPELQEDPTPVTLLGQSVVEVLTFTEITASLPGGTAALRRGLKVGDSESGATGGGDGVLEPVQLLVLHILKRATVSTARMPVQDEVLLSQDIDLVRDLIDTWLTTTSVSVAQRAFEVIVSLLETEKPKVGQMADILPTLRPERLAFWDAMFMDERVYDRLFHYCDPRSTQLTKRTKSIAQSRLMSLVTKAASIDWSVISRPCIPGVESRYSCASLLEFAALEMVDQDDILLAANHVDFLRDLLVIRPTEGESGESHTSPSLEYLMNTGLHERILGFYLDPSTMDQTSASFLMGGVVNYFASYARTYPKHICQQRSSFTEKLMSRIVSALDIKAVDFANETAPTRDLEVLKSLPRSLLLKVEFTRNPLRFIPTNPHNQPAFDVLGAIFHGQPSQPQLQGDKSDIWSNDQRIAARRLYLQYFSHNPRLWQDVIAAADTTALPDVASSAVSFIASILTSKWAVHSPQASDRAITGPGTGLQALLTGPVLTTVFPWLMRPPPATNMTSQGSDVVWRMASEKYELVKSFRARMNADDVDHECAEIEGFADLKQKVEERFAAGRIFPYEDNASSAGGEIATMGL